MKNINELQTNIKTTISTVDECKKQINDINAEINTILNRDDEYIKLEAVISAATSQKASLKRKLMKENSDLLKLTTKIKDLKESKKEQQLYLSDYLKEYITVTGQDNINGRFISVKCKIK